VKTKSTFATMLFAFGALAQSQSFAGNDFDDRWYVTPSLSYIIADNDRKADDDFGFGLGVGKPLSKYWNLELNGVYDQLDVNNSSSSYKQAGMSLDGLFFFNRNASFSPYGLVGIGALNTKVNNERNTNLMGQIGLGAMKVLNDYGISLRGDARFRVDNDDNSIPKEDRFGDFLVNLSLVIPLGSKAKQAAPLAAIAAPVVAAAAEMEPKEEIPKKVKEEIKIAEPVVAKVRDLDNDGIPDNLDHCNDTPRNVAIDSMGCPTDIDGDGIADYLDMCSNTNSGAFVDATGCEPDSDNDGIADVRDLCADTGTTTSVGEDGCALSQIVKTRDYNFDFGSTGLSEEAQQTLTVIADRLKQHPTEKIEIVGHTDNVGSSAANNRLSIERAKKVQEYFLEQGIVESRLVIRGAGANNPIADNETDAGRAKNRRVEMYVLD